MATLETTIQQTHEWAVERINDLTDVERDTDAFSMVQEFREWLDHNKDDHEIVSLEYIGEDGELWNLLGLE